jgi:ABC-2 type transport system ATP-binding protein
LILSWFNTHLKGEADNTKANFIATLSAGNVVGRNSSSLKFFEGAQYTGLFGEAQTVVQVAGKSQRIVAPAGGEPALMTVLPGLGGSLASLVGRGLPNQSAVFSSEPFATSTPLLGSSTVKLRVTSEIDREEAVFFASLRIQSGVDAQRFPNGLVSPIRVENLQAGVPVEFTITLPTIVAEVNAGEQLQLVISSTDAAYTLPQTPGVYSIELVDGRVAVPQTALTLINNERSPITWLLLAAAVIVGLALLVWLRRPRMKTAEFKPEYADVPLRVENLVKEFKGGHRAVDDISWDVPAGVVLGLLGPNGAGKTTTMRMAMGLINPTSGSVYVFGHEVQPGSPALSRIGALVEGAGFLPHLTGRENLMLFWQASGRTTEDPQLDAVLAIADLGTAADKRVRAYSQGMRQRLGIAQAMLGMPDLLMLDEPTNGLDPPQIRAMRTMMQEYAATGRTVIVSSHLLSEVEQTCSHVIVMHRGRLVTRGRVDELMAGKGNMRLEDFFIEVVGDDLTVGK